MFQMLLFFHFSILCCLSIDLQPFHIYLIEMTTDILINEMNLLYMYLYVVRSKEVEIYAELYQDQRVKNLIRGEGI